MQNVYNCILQKLYTNQNILWTPWKNTYSGTCMYAIRRFSGRKLINKLIDKENNILNLKNQTTQGEADRVIFSCVKTYSCTISYLTCLDIDSSIHANHLYQHRISTQLIKNYLTNS
jgi:hypothetical protein